MKVKVIEKFRDKYTFEIYQVGSVIEIDDERLKEIQKIGNFVEKVKKGKSLK